MKKFLLVFFIAVFFLDYSFFSNFPGGFFADESLFLGFLLALFAQRNFDEGFFWAVLGGIFLDYFSSFFWGTNLISVILIFLILDFLKGKLFSAETSSLFFFFIFFLLLILFFAIQFYLSLFLAVLNLGSGASFFVRDGFLIFFLSRAFFAFLAAVFLSGFRKLENFIGESQMRLKV